MTNKQIIGLIIVGLTVLGAISMITGGSGQEIPVTTPQVKESVYQDVVEDAYKNLYVEACMEEAPYSYCNCTWNHMENALGRQRMLDMMIDFDGVTFPEPMINAVYDCMIKHQ